MATATINRINQNGHAKNGSTKEADPQGQVEKSKKKQIILDRPMVEMTKLRIVGLTDLICKQMSAKTQEKLVVKGGRGCPRPKEARDPHDDFCESLYLMPGSKPAGTKGAKYGFPASGIKRSVQTAAGRFLKDGTTLNGMIVAGSLYVLPTEAGSDLVRINHAANDPYMRSDQGRNPNSGGAVVIHRGAFAKWSMDLVVRYNASVLSIEQIATLFMWAGFSVGIGEWRPEKNGTYGQFEVAVGK